MSSPLIVSPPARVVRAYQVFWLVLFVMKRAGLNGTVHAAAVLNITVSLLAYIAHRRSQRPGEIAKTLAAVTSSASAKSEPSA